jgi:hypothetical protein
MAMTNQTNEEINVKGEHPPRVWIVGKNYDDGHYGYAAFYTDPSPAKPGETIFPMMPVSEHQEITATYKDLLKMKDAEIKELKAYKDLHQERSRETHAVCIHAMSELEAKLARAKKYIAHKSNCEMRVHNPLECDCTCGLKKLLADIISATRLDALEKMTESEIDARLIEKGIDPGESVKSMDRAFGKALAEFNGVSATPVLADKFVFGQEVEDK